MTAATIFQCHPVKAAWDPLRTTKKECILFGSFTLAYEVSNVVIDLAILLLPLCMIRLLHLSTKKKWALSLVFLLGGLYVCPVRLTWNSWTNRSSVCITGILRIVYSYDPKEPIAGRLSSS